MIINFLHNGQIVPKELYQLIEEDKNALINRLSTSESQREEMNQTQSESSSQQPMSKQSTRNKAEIPEMDKQKPNRSQKPNKDVHRKLSVRSDSKVKKPAQEIGI